MADELKPCPAPGEEAMGVWREVFLGSGDEGRLTIQRLIDQRDAARTALFNGGAKYYAEGFRAGQADMQARAGEKFNDVRATNAGNFKREGKEWSAYDLAVRECATAILSLEIKDAPDEN